MDQQLIDKLEKLDQVKTSLFELKRKLLEDKISEQPYNLTITKFLILKFIGISSKRMVAEISSNLKLTSGATTILLNQLERYGLKRKENQTLRNYARYIDTFFSTGEMTKLTANYEQYLYHRKLPEGSWKDTRELWENLIKKTIA